ncbi:DUF6221 family protein [Streptomyces sp. NRRL S-813]|uniref:DUF6221 family protein n=1 Tax=Streptomyces sp. NRRL S-813 TaxID=1463919 RepID=UPI0004BFC7C2|nr:DUF6221 family protein [Streptomyces sp. NRRL S-813]
MSDLVEFLRARLDEDEQVARDAAAKAAATLAGVAAKEGVWKPPYTDVGPTWTFDYDHVFVTCDRPGQPRLAMLADCGSGAFRLTPHIARHDPARVLAEVEAKRDLLEALINEGHAALRPGGSTEVYCGADYGTGDPCDCGRNERLSRYLRLLAKPYADHPDYRAKWRAEQDTP